MATQDKRAYVRDMFARIAPRYDLLNRLMTLGRDMAWREQTAYLALNSFSAPRVLDLATGTGDLAFAILRAAPQAQVTGLDLVAEMLHLAKAKSAGPTYQLVNGDALFLPFPNSNFDVIVSAFMLRNVVDLERAFAEMVRVCRPGGRVAALEITQPRLPLWRDLYRFYFYQLVPLLGGALSDRSAYRYLPTSLSIFVSADELAALMRRAGLEHVNYRLLNLGTVAIHWGDKPV